MSINDQLYCTTRGTGSLRLPKSRHVRRRLVGPWGPDDEDER